MVRDYAAADALRLPGLPTLLRAYVENGPQHYVDNADVELRVLEIGGRYLPLVIPNPAACNTDVCSPYAHYVLYTLKEFGKRHPWVPRVLLRVAFGVWGRLLGKHNLDRVVYVNNWLFSTNPRARLSADEVKAVTRWLMEKYPGLAICFRSVLPGACGGLEDGLLQAGYHLVPTRTVYLLAPLPKNPARWKNNTRRDVALLSRLGMLLRGGDGFKGDAEAMTRLYRGLYLDKHNRLNQQFNRRFFEMLVESPFLETLFIVDGKCLVGFTSFWPDGNMLLAHIVGYQLDYPGQVGVYRQIVAALMLEAQSRGLVLHLSAGVGEFKLHRGASAFVEYDAVMTRGTSLRQRLAWRLIELQGRFWSGRRQP